jgi:hypothetical protein
VRTGKAAEGHLSREQPMPRCRRVGVSELLVM